MVADFTGKRGLRYYLDAWVAAARPITLTAAVVPVLVGTALAAQVGRIEWALFILAFLGSVLIQVGTNLADEYTDHRGRASARKYPAPHKVIARGLLTERAVLYGVAASFGLSTAMGLYIVHQVGWPILVVGILSTMAGYMHSSGPFPLGHHLLGELTVFIFMGPLIVMAAYYVQLQEVTWAAFWGSVPIGLLVTAILQCNNLRDRDDDKAEGKRTIATLLRVGTGRWVYTGLIFGGYLFMTADVLLGILPLATLAAWATAPMAYPLVRRLHTAASRPDYNLVLVGSAKLHAYFGSTMAIAIGLHAILR